MAGRNQVSSRATAHELERGYKRSRERIIDDVAEALTRAREPDAGEITVEVTDDRDVILGGEVADEAGKRLAGELAADVVGVRDVRNGIRVRAVSRRIAP